MRTAHRSIRADSALAVPRTGALERRVRFQHPIPSRPLRTGRPEDDVKIGQVWIITTALARGDVWVRPASNMHVDQRLDTDAVRQYWVLAPAEI